jgi:hypothetical protein
MTSRDFVYWLQGYFEILGSTGNRDTNEGALTSGQVECIRKHLAMVFIHEIDPSHGGKEHQGTLTNVHAGGGHIEYEGKPPRYRC